MWLHNRLWPIEGARYQSENHETCLDGTQTAELKQINKWEKDDNAKAIYWLSGPTGSGKSTIAQTFAGYLLWCTYFTQVEHRIHDLL
jgi:energy-coupling factor transporter ATP-binding protein EcfA2